MSAIAKRNLLQRLERSGLLRALSEDVQALSGSTLEFVVDLPEAPPPPRFRGALVIPFAIGAVDLGRLMVINPGDERKRAALRRWVRTAADAIGQQLLKEGASPVSLGVVPGKVERASRLIRENFSDPISLGEVASAVGLSRERLSRLFHESLGMTFSDYLNSVRLEECRRRLRETSEPITTIAFACGFQSLSQFNRRFKQAEGLPPRMYRRQHEGAANSGFSAGVVPPLFIRP